MNWYFEVLKKYTVFSGRARRKEYWLFVLFNNLISLALFSVDLIIGTNIGILGLLSGIYGVVMLLPSIAVAVRRLHDTGRSGWWLCWWLLCMLIPSIMMSLLFYMQKYDWLTPCFILSLIILISFTVLICEDSQPGENKYGPNPKGIES